MPNWKKVITSGSDAQLNDITASNAIFNDIRIDGWGSVSASLSTTSTPHLKLFANETNIRFEAPYDWYNGTQAATLTLITGSVADGQYHIPDANAVYDYVNPISASIATDIASLSGAGYGDVGTAASSSRIAIWEDGNTIGANSTLYYNSAGLIVNNGRTVGGAHGSSWSSGNLLIKIGNPLSSVGAHITYTLYRADASRSNMRAGNITAAWNYNGSSITFNETTTTDIGTVPATITNTIVLLSGDIYLRFTNNSGTLYSVWANVDTMGLY